MSIGAMFEEKLGQEYKLYNNINEDPFTFKEYPNKLVMNEHKMYELKLNLSDVVLKGSGNSIDFMPEVLTKY